MHVILILQDFLILELLLDIEIQSFLFLRSLFTSFEMSHTIALDIEVCWFLVILFGDVVMLCIIFLVLAFRNVPGPCMIWNTNTIG